jgi:peptide-N4-(N-acetyl-beta-glucosaminyl)asparagine amidase
MDVTRRYVRNPAEHGMPRNKCPEEVLLYIIHEIRKLRRENMDKAIQTRLRKEDDREERELRSYVAHSITHEMLNSFPGAVATPTGSDVVKSIEERQRELEAQQMVWRGQDSR